MSIIGLIIIVFGLGLLAAAAAIITLLWNKVRVLERRLLQVEAQLAVQVENEGS